MKNAIARIANEIWPLPSVRVNLECDLTPRQHQILDLLIKIRLLSFAFVSAPISSLIPFALTGKKELGLACFGMGTISIVIGLVLFRKPRSVANPISLIRKGAVATIMVNALLGLLMLAGGAGFLQPGKLVIIYVISQLFSGIPFALINGVDSKLSGALYRVIGNQRKESFSPNALFRRCRAAGSTAATALGALIWAIVLFFEHNARTNAGYYAIIFAAAIVPALFLLRYLRQLEDQIKTDHNMKRALVDGPYIPISLLGGPRRTELGSSVVAIGCLEGLLQFSQFYFSLGAIRLLFDAVPDYRILVIAIPLMFYLINGLEQMGALLFSTFQSRKLMGDSANPVQLIRVRQWASLVLLVFAASFFAFHSAVGYGLEWSMWLDVAAYGCFNIIKGFAGGLSEQWNEAIRSYDSLHDEAGFSTASAFFGRLYQIASITCFFVLNRFMIGNNEIDLISKQTRALTGTLTAFVFVLFAANMLAYSWMEQTKQRQPDTTWTVLFAAVLNRRERTALFTQMVRVLFVASLILSNFLAVKFVTIGGMTFTHGSIIYVAVFVLINLISVFESEEAAIKTAFLGMVSYLFCSVMLLVSACAPGALTVSTNLISNGNYNQLLGGEIAWLFLISFAGYLATIPLNVRLVSLLQTHFAKLQPWALGAAVTFVCQLVDTFIFVWFGFFFRRVPQPENPVKLDLTSMLFGQFSVKFSVYLVMYFPLYVLIYFCSKYLGIAAQRDRDD